jgi:hypothetical protein
MVIIALLEGLSINDVYQNKEENNNFTNNVI